MYSKKALELYANRENEGHIKKPTIISKHENPICGDEINVELKIKNNKIIDIKYTNKKECFVTLISASVLSKKIIGMDIDQVLNLDKEDIDKLLGTKVIETRIKCELLPLEAIKKAIYEIKNVRN